MSYGVIGAALAIVRHGPGTRRAQRPLRPRARPDLRLRDKNEYVWMLFGDEVVPESRAVVQWMRGFAGAASSQTGLRLSRRRAPESRWWHGGLAEHVTPRQAVVIQWECRRHR